MRGANRLPTGEGPIGKPQSSTKNLGGSWLHRGNDKCFMAYLIQLLTLKVAHERIRTAIHP